MSSSGRRLRYRTPADVRAIPNGQWERWVLEHESFPFSGFSAERAVQKTVRTIFAATSRRVKAMSPLDGPAQPWPKPTRPPKGGKKK